jgi:hypothetical protein
MSDIPRSRRQQKSGDKPGITSPKPPWPIRNRHDYVFFATVWEILHLDGNNYGLHVDLRSFRTLN